MQHDIETARHGGIHSCAVLTGYNTLEQLRAAEPDMIVEHLGELRRMLEQNGLAPQAARRNNSRKSIRRSPPSAALIFNAAGEVLMIRTHKWSNLWGIPGGKIKWGETSEAALRREIQEETGLEVTRHRVRAGAGLHPLEGILSRRAFRAAELHLPLRREKSAREIERGRPRISLGQARCRLENEIEQADKNIDPCGSQINKAKAQTLKTNGAISPRPSPLPKGEGESFAAVLNLMRRGLPVRPPKVQEDSLAVPSPWGEGQGEGKRQPAFQTVVHKS